MFLKKYKNKNNSCYSSKLFWVISRFSGESFRIRNSYSDFLLAIVNINEQKRNSCTYMVWSEIQKSVYSVFKYYDEQYILMWNYENVQPNIRTTLIIETLKILKKFFWLSSPIPKENKTVKSKVNEITAERLRIQYTQGRKYSTA